MWRKAITPAKHRHHDSDNVTFTDGRGNSRSYTLSRLEREAPELFKKVLDRKMTANQAAIKAGFRPPTVTVRIDSVERALTTLMKYFSREELWQGISTNCGQK
jgi:hypothetical protein